MLARRPKIRKGYSRSQVLCGVLMVLLVVATAFSVSLATTDWPSLLEQVAPAVVLIEAPVDEEMSSFGSGAVISSDGYILTAQHVIDETLSVHVYVPASGSDSGKFSKYEAEIIEASADADIAILKIDATGLPSLSLGDSDTLQLDEEIRLLGYPQQAAGVGLIIGRGTFLGSRIALDVDDVRLIQIDVSPFDHGHSGGPVINATGEIVGVAVHTWTGVEEGAETHKLAVSANTAKRFIPGSDTGTAVSPIGTYVRGPAPTSWEIYGYSGDQLFIISGDPQAFPSPMPRPLPGDWSGCVIAGPDGLFYCTDTPNGEILRFDPRTRKPTTVFEDAKLYPYDLEFDLEGNLLFSTYDRDGDNRGKSEGIWRVSNPGPNATAEKIIDGAEIRECGALDANCRLGPTHLCVLKVGRYRGDLLVGGKDDVPIARAIGPDYTRIVTFIQEEESTYMSSDEDPIPTMLSDYHQVEATGAVLATDFINGRILEFDSEGNFVGVFCDLYRANRVTSDYEGNVYASGSAWGRRNLQHIAGFTAEGERIFEIPINDVTGVIIVEE